MLWDNPKIIAAGLSLIYANSASKLWGADKWPPSTPPASSTQPAVARDPDVLALVPPTEDIVRQESIWSLAADSSQLMKLALWQPNDEGEECLREFLLDFGHDVAAKAWTSAGRQGSLCDEQTYAKLKELVFKDELFALLLVETPLKGARLYIDRLRYVLSRSTFKHSDRVTAHFGGAGLPDCKAAVAEDLVRQAEESLRATRREPERKRAKLTGSDDRQLNLGQW